MGRLRSDFSREGVSVLPEEGERCCRSPLLPLFPCRTEGIGRSILKALPLAVQFPCEFIKCGHFLHVKITSPFCYFLLRISLWLEK